MNTFYWLLGNITQFAAGALLCAIAVKKIPWTIEEGLIALLVGIALVVMGLMTTLLAYVKKGN